jgi:hypothetical protein
MASEGWPFLAEDPRQQPPVQLLLLHSQPIQLTLVTRTLRFHTEARTVNHSQ